MEQKMNADKNISEIHQTFIRKAERYQQQQSERTRLIKMKNRISGLFLTAVVSSICN